MNERDRWRKKQEQQQGTGYWYSVAFKDANGNTVAPDHAERREYEEAGNGRCEYCGIPDVKLVYSKATTSTTSDDAAYGSIFSWATPVKREKVCRMCFDMTEPIAMNQHFIEQQEKWEQQQKRIRKILREVNEL